MTPSNENVSATYAVVCIANQDMQPALTKKLRDILGNRFSVVECLPSQDLHGLLNKLTEDFSDVPLIIKETDNPKEDAQNLIAKLKATSNHTNITTILLSSTATKAQPAGAIPSGATIRLLDPDWTHQDLRDAVSFLLTNYFVLQQPESLNQLGNLIDVQQLCDALVATRRDRHALDVQIRTLRRSFLANMDMSDGEVESAMGAAFDEALGTPSRQTHPAGTVILRQDDSVSTISLVEHGQVFVSRRAGDKEVTLYTYERGRLIGLLSLAHRQKAFFTYKAATDVTIIPLSVEQLDTALQKDPWLSSYLVTSLIRAAAFRAQHTADLMVEVERLNGSITKERDQLADTLRKLEEAQMRVVESEKMATLGQISAGVAHELNNPVAAIERATDFMSEDLIALLDKLPEGATAKACLLSAMDREAISTKELRRLRSSLAKSIGDPALAERLVRIGVTTPQQYKAEFGRLTPAERNSRIDAMERYYQLGLSLRNLSSCSERIAALVTSLRSYARPDGNGLAAADVHKGLENTLLMFSHDLHEVEVTKEYGDLPLVECCPTEINQVWTNFISNALQAMDRRGSLKIETGLHDKNHVFVRIIDSGPGIAKEHLDRVFDLNFTTRTGQNAFGLGVGLTICQQIVSRHGGKISAESEPGRTCMSVILPIHH